MSDMRSLRDLYGYNAWANAHVFALCRDLNHAWLEADAPGTFGTIEETLAHMMGVETVYLYMLRGEFDALDSVREQSADLTLDAWASRAVRLGEEYLALIDGADAAFGDESLQVPWFDFALTKHDGLLQVLNHSAQHRAQVLSVLGERGLPVLDVDYVLFVKDTQARAATTDA